MKIGVFDSGVGGLSFVSKLKAYFPDATIVYKEDKEHLPYGDKTPQQLLEFTLPIFKSFEAEGCDAVLVACNTLTTNCITDLRVQSTVPLVGVEPMIKPAAAMTKTGVIAVCATRGTLASKRYAELKEKYAKNIQIIEPDCTYWAELIEKNQKNELRLQELVADLRSESVDVVVLGCTHYHWIETELQQLAGNDMKVIQPIEPVITQLKRVLINPEQHQ